MNKNQMTELLLEAKAAKNLTFAQIAEAIGRSEVWTAAAIMGQQTMDSKEAETIVNLLEVPNNKVVKFLQTIPYRGASLSMPPTDPTIYRFYELILVYGETIKALIHEKFGDGIMSAIDFSMDMDKENNPQGDRVVITLNGKFLPYKKF